MKKFFLILLLLFVVGLGVTFFWVQTESGQKRIGKEIAKVLEKHIGAPIKIKGLRVEFPLLADAKSISGDGFSAEKVHIKLSLWNLLRGNLVIRSLIADRLELFPVDTQETSFSLPTAHIDFFSFRELVYQNECLGAEGELHLGEIFSAAIQINYQDAIYKVALNGEETALGLTTQFFCSKQDDFVEGTISFENAKLSFDDMHFSYDAMEGAGSVYLTEKQEWQFALTVRQKNLEINKFELNNITVGLNGLASRNEIKGHFQGTADSVEASSNFVWDYHDLVTLDSLSIETAAFSSQGKCSIALKEKRVLGIWNGELPAYGTSFLLAVNGDKADFTASSPRLTYQGKEFTDLKLTASLANLFDVPFGTLELSGEHEDFKIRIASEIDLSQDEHPFHVQGRWLEKGICQAEGLWNLNRILVSECKGELLNQAFELKDPFKVSAAEITPFSFYLGDGQVTVACQWNDQFAFASECQHISLDLLQLVEQAPRLDGLANFSLHWDGSEGALELSLFDVVIHEEIHPPIPPFNTTLHATFDWQSIQGSGEIVGNNLHPILFDGKVTQKNLALHIEAKDEIAQFMQLLFFQNAVHLSGTAFVFIDVSGTWQNPEIRGVVDWKEGTFELPDTGLLYKNITAHLVGNGNKLILEYAQAKDPEGGDLAVTGSMDLLPDQFYPFSLDLQVKNAPLLQLDYATAKGNGHLTLSGTLLEADLTGKLEADSLKIRIPEKAKSSVSTIPVSYINQSDDALQPSSSLRPPTSWPIHLDLACEFKEPVSIKGKNFKSTWNGRMQVKGTATEPLLFGDFKVLTGEYNFRGKMFEIKEGTIFFGGEKPTTLYVIGRQEIEDIEATVILKGPLSSPSLSFRSNPPMPQREILSYILFGHTSSELTPFQGTELSESITDINGATSPDLITRISETIGVDKIDISSSDVKVGKYISKGVMVSIDKSMTEEANKLSVEAKVIKDIRFQGQIGDDSEGQLLLKWKKDY